MTRTTSPATAFGVAAGGIAVYAGMDAIMKGLSIASGAYFAVLWRSVAGVVLLAPIFVARGGRWPAWAALRLHLARGGVGGASVLLFFWGLVRVPMAQGVAPVEYTAFVWSALFGWLVFAERVSPWTVAGALLIIAGCLVAVRRPVPAPQTEASL